MLYYHIDVTNMHLHRDSNQLCASYFTRPAGPRPDLNDGVGSWASGYGQLLEMLLD